MLAEMMNLSDFRLPYDMVLVDLSQVIGEIESGCDGAKSGDCKDCLGVHGEFSEGCCETRKNYVIKANG